MGCHVDGDRHDGTVAGAEGGEVGVGGIGLQVGELTREPEGIQTMRIGKVCMRTRMRWQRVAMAARVSSLTGTSS